MKVSTLKQDTPEWIEWRNTGLGASDAAVIIGESPYETAFGLWQIKTGRKPPPDFSKNPNVQRGKRLEPLARRIAEQYIGEKLYPLCASEEIEDFILTSFDGITESNEIVCELKCPHPMTFSDVKINGEISKAYKLYWHQAQQQLLVSDAKICYLIFFLKGEDGCKDQIIPFEIYPDKTFQTNILIPTLKHFWQCILDDTEPKRDVKRDPCEVDNKSWAEIANDYIPLKEEIKEYERKLKKLKSEVKPYENRFIDLMQGNYKACESGVKATRVDKNSNTDKDAAIDELLMILSKRKINISKEALLTKHKKDDSFHYRFSLSNDAEVSLNTVLDESSGNDVVGWY